MTYYRERVLSRGVLLTFLFSSSVDHTQRVGFWCVRLYHNKYDTHTHTQGPLYRNTSRRITNIRPPPNSSPDGNDPARYDNN